MTEETKESEETNEADGGLYNPGAFRVEDPTVLADTIDRLVFATLVSNGADGPKASHLPVLLDRAAGAQGTLRGHLARANDHWASLDGEPVLLIFHGPQHYVTPGWYPSKAETGKVVPTWNYLVVHARGRAHVHQDPLRLRSLVGALTDRMEASRDQPWAVEDAPAAFVTRMVEQIVGLDIEISHLEGKFKLGQNRPEADRAGLAAGLESEQAVVASEIRALSGPHSPDPD